MDAITQAFFLSGRLPKKGRACFPGMNDKAKQTVGQSGTCPLGASWAGAGFNLGCSALHALKGLSHDRLGTWLSVPLAPLRRDV